LHGRSRSQAGLALDPQLGLPSPLLVGHGAPVIDNAPESLRSVARQLRG